MADNIEISIREEIQNAAKAMQNVTSAVFAGTPGVASTIKGKRKSAQFTFKLKNANDKRSIQSQGRRQILTQIFSNKAVEVERTIKRAMEAVIVGLVGASSPNIRVLNRSLGSAKPTRRIEEESFAKFIKSKAGAGEIGLPDPDKSLNNLKIALVASITVDVIVRGDGPQIKFTFDQRKLLKLTPHPDRFEGGISAPFFSWLSLVTGPDFLRGGTPGFGLVRVIDLRETLRNSRSLAEGGKIARKRVSITESLIRASRTRGNAGDLAAIMLSTRFNKSGRTAAEAFGGVQDDYKPDARFQGFWDSWWSQNKLELGTWSRRVIAATIRALLKG